MSERTVHVTVHYMTQIKRTAGCATEGVELPATGSMRELVRTLADRHGPPFRALLVDETNEPRRWLLFFIGDQHADLNRSLQDGDAVTVLAPMAGG
jgi:molybdopterin converting factor small subunit